MKLLFISILAAVIASLWYFRINIIEKLTVPKKCNVSRNFTYWPVVLNQWNKNDNLRSHKRVFDRLGYRMVNGSEENW